MDRVNKPTSNRAQSFKKKSTTIDKRLLRAHRRSQEWKQLRTDQVNSNRNLEQMSPVKEETAPKNGNKKSGENRRDALKKWKEERDLKRKLEAQQKAKKPTFKVSAVIEPKIKPLPKVVPDTQLGTSHNQSRRVTRSSSVSTSGQNTTMKAKQPAKVAVNTSTRCPVTRSYVTPVAEPPTTRKAKSQPSAKAPVGRATRQSTAKKACTSPVTVSRSSRSAASQGRNKEPKAAPKVAFSAPGEQQSRASTRTRTTRSSVASVKVSKEESTDDETKDLPPTKMRAVSAGRTPKRVGRTTRSQSRTRDEVISVAEDKTESTKSKPVCTSSDENSLLARDNCSSSDEASVKPTTSTPFICPRPFTSSVSDTNSEDEDRTFSAVSNKFISSERGNLSFAPKDFVFMPPANISLLKLKPLSPTSTSDFLYPGQDHVFTTPTQRAPRARTSSSKRRTPSHKNIRNSLILAHKSPEEGIEILKQSPMIEIKRRTPKHLSPSPIDQMPNLDDIPEGVIPPPQTLNFDVDSLGDDPESATNPAQYKDSLKAAEKITSSPKRLDSIEEEMELKQTDSCLQVEESRCNNVDTTEGMTALEQVTAPEEPAKYPAPSCVNVVGKSDAIITVLQNGPTNTDVLPDPEADQSTITDITIDLPEHQEVQYHSETCTVRNSTSLGNEEDAVTKDTVSVKPSSEPEQNDSSKKGSESGSTSHTASEEHMEPTSATVPNIKYFRDLLLSETDRLACLCNLWEDISKNTPELKEEVQGQIRTTIGQAQLLMAQRFKQFSGLIDNSEFKTGEKEINCTDLQGFWDMVYFQVEDVDVKFTKLDNLKNNNWVLDEPKPKKVIKKKQVEGKPKTVKPAAGRSNFAAFRAKLKQKQEEAKEADPQSDLAASDVCLAEVRVPQQTEAVAEPVVIGQSQETKTFDAGFFQVSSPVSSPKAHCKVLAGSPGRLRLQRESNSPYFAVAIENTLKDSLGSSPLLKASEHQLNLSYEPSPSLVAQATAASTEEGSEAEICQEDIMQRLTTAQSVTVSPMGLRKTPRRSLRTPASVLRAKGGLLTSGALSPLVTAEMKEKTTEAEFSVSETVDINSTEHQPSLFTPEDTKTKVTPRKSRRLTRQSLRILNFTGEITSNPASENVKTEMESGKSNESASTQDDDIMNFSKYLAPQSTTSDTGLVSSEKENIDVSSPVPRRRSKSASHSIGSPLTRSSRSRVISTPSCGDKKRPMTDILFTPFQKMATPVKPAKEDEDMPSPTINLMSFSPLGQH